MQQLFGHFRKPEVALTTGLFLLFNLILFSIETTGDSGDSVMHYLFSHYAFEHPENFMDHWAKPIFVLLSAPFAIFGFKGIMIFNSLCASLAFYFGYRIAESLKLKFKWLLAVIPLFSPLYFNLLFSGLTEYLFATFLVAAVWLSIQQKFLLSSLLVSCLPLIRSEGLIILIVFILFFIFIKKYRFLPFLLVAQLIYGIVGIFYFGDLLWIFNKIPYANVGSPYGNGGPFDFAFKLLYVIEKPLFVLLLIGIGSIFYKIIKRQTSPKNNSSLLLLVGTFSSIIIAHGLFWWLGIFNSMGLPRVIIMVVPIGCILILYGVQTIVDLTSNQRIQHLILSGWIGLIIVVPFLPKENGIVYDAQMFDLADNQVIDQEIVPFIEDQVQNENKIGKMYFSHPYLSLALDIDYFDSSKHREMQYLLTDSLKDNDLIIWDNWFGNANEQHILDFLNTQQEFHELAHFRRKTSKSEIEFIIFQYHP